MPAPQTEQAIKDEKINNLQENLLFLIIIFHLVPPLTWMALVSMVVFIACYSIGIGPVAWLLVGEIIPVRARQNAAGLSTAFNLLLVFLLTSLFSTMLVSGFIFDFSITNIYKLITKV